MIVVSGEIEVAEAGLDRAVAAAREMTAATQQEEGCLFYTFYRDLENPCLFRVFEEWRDDAALKAHFDSAHMGHFRERLAGAKVVRRDVKRYVVSDVSSL